MTEKRHIPGFVYKLMLLAATIIWGFAFVVMKDAVDVLPPAQLIGVRFFLTGLLMAAVFHRSLKGALNGPCLKAGLVLAVVTFLAFWVQTVGLADTTPGKNAFLTATYCVIVPFMLWAVAGKRPTFANVGAAALCITGIGLVSLTAGSLAFEFGDAMTLLCAVFFAAQIIAIARYSKRFDVLALTVYQFLFGGIAGLVVGALTEPAPNLAALTPEFAFKPVLPRGVRLGAVLPLPERGARPRVAGPGVASAVPGIGFRRAGQRAVLRRGGHRAHGGRFRPHFRRHPDKRAGTDTGKAREAPEDERIVRCP